jgi:hypothetical protein
LQRSNSVPPVKLPGQLQQQVPSAHAQTRVGSSPVLLSSGYQRSNSVPPIKPSGQPLLRVPSARTQAQVEPLPVLLRSLSMVVVHPPENLPTPYTNRPVEPSAQSFSSPKATSTERRSWRDVERTPRQRTPRERTTPGEKMPRNLSRGLDRYASEEEMARKDKLSSTKDLRTELQRIESMRALRGKNCKRSD